MVDTIGQWLSAIMDWAAAIPLQGWALLLGVLIGGAVTQWTKRTFPVAVLWPSLSKPKQVMVIRSYAFVAAFVPTYVLWPADVYELWAALAVGFSTPSIYKLISYFVYKRFPDLETRWSGT